MRWRDFLCLGCCCLQAPGQEDASPCIRSIVYIGAGSFEVGTSRLLALGAVGLASLVIAVFAPSFNPLEMHEKIAAKMAGKKVGKLAE